MTLAAFDPPTLQLLRRVFDEVAHDNPKLDRFDLAGRILECAANGERDPVRLGRAAVRKTE